MNIMELKEQINNKDTDNSFKIFVCPENYFLADQYVNEICHINNCVTNKITSIFEPITSALSLVIDYDSRLNVLKTDLFDEKAEDYSKFENTIVICKKVDKTLEPLLKDYIVVFPKLEDWQVKSFVKLNCPSLSDEELDWIYTVTQGDIYKIMNEIDKLTLFDSSVQHDILNELRFEPNTDLFYQQIFNLAEAIIKKDYSSLTQFLLHEKNFNFDPIAVSNIILSTLKKIVLIKLNSGANADQIGVSPKQYAAFKKYLYNNINLNDLFKQLEFISGIDLRLKSSELSLSKDRLLDYIICKMS